MLEAVGQGGLGTVAELCCGRSEALTLFGGRVRRYIGIDVSESMLQSTVGLGGTHLYLQKRSADWALVRGIAYDCRPGVRHSRRVIRAKG